MDLSKLKDPFPEEDVKWRIQRSGFKRGEPWAMVMAYIDNRAIMDRLDDVCGIDGWANEFRAGPCGGVMCGIGVRVPEGLTTVKWDGADNSIEESIKGGLSAAMKRAAVQWGIGRYLYDLEATFARINENGVHRAKIEDENGREHWLKWDSPPLPPWALPQDRRTAHSPPEARAEAQAQPVATPAVSQPVAAAPEPERPEPPPGLAANMLGGASAAEPDRGPDGTWATPQEEQGKKIHALGLELYPDRAEWDKQRKDLCLVVSKKRTVSLKDLTPYESADLYGRLMNENNRRKALPRASVPNESTPGEVNPLSLVMHFGKNKGLTLGQIQQEDSGYIDWLQEKWNPEYQGSISKQNQELLDALVLMKVGQHDGARDHDPRPAEWPNREPDPGEEESPFLPGSDPEVTPDDIPF